MLPLSATNITTHYQQPASTISLSLENPPLLALKASSFFLFYSNFYSSQRWTLKATFVMCSQSVFGTCCLVGKWRWSSLAVVVVGEYISIDGAFLSSATSGEGRRRRRSWASFKLSGCMFFSLLRSCATFFPPPSFPCLDEKKRLVPSFSYRSIGPTLGHGRNDFRFLPLVHSRVVDGMVDYSSIFDDLFKL